MACAEGKYWHSQPGVSLRVLALTGSPEKKTILCGVQFSDRPNRNSGIKRLLGSRGKPKSTDRFGLP